MRSAKRWLAIALLLLIGSLMLSPVGYAADTGGFVEFYSAYGTSYEEVYPNGFEEAHSDFVYGNTNNALINTLPKAFRFEVVVCDDINFNFIAKPKEPIYIEAEMGETTTKHIKFSFDRDGKSNEINLNLSINPANQGSEETPQNSTSYAIFYAYNGQITEGDHSYNVKSHEGSGFIGGMVAKVFEKYPYIKFELSSSYSLLLKLVAIVPGNKMTDQVHLKYSGRTEYEQLKEFGIKNNFGGYNGIKSAYYTITYDKASDLMRRYAVITEIRTDNPNFNIVHSVGDEWEFTISSGIQNAPERLFYNDIINIKSKASVLKWSIPEFTFKQRGVESSPLRLRMVLDSARFDLEFINPDRADDFVYKEYLYTGRSYENPQIVTQEVDMTTKLDQILFSDDADPKLTAIYYDSSDVVLKIHRIYSVYYPPFYKPTITVPKAPDGVKPVSGGPSGTNNQSIDTDADDNPGETDVTIPAALAIVIIGGGAAMAGAGTGGKSGDDDGKKKSRYKMCLRKDFGDAIRYDTQPVTVYARIVEITPEGEEIDRPDLSARIEMFSGGGLKVEGTAIADNYMGALVCAESVPGGQNPDSGVLSIRFSGEGGSFQNNVTFRLVGKPRIYFPEQGNYLTMTLPMLLGDGEVYETPVILHDFLEKPTSVRLDVAEGVPLSCKLEETEEANETNYLLKVKNLSGKPETPQAVKLMFGIGILAENDKEKAEEGVKAELYPEGLSIREVKFDDQGYVLIDTFDNEATEEWGDVLPTGFVLDFAVPEQGDKGRPTVRVLEPSEFNPVFNGLKGTDERTNHLAERFKYSIQEAQSNSKEYKFAPQEALVEEKDKPYYLTLPISCAYGQEEYTLDLPIRLLGGGPGPLAGWDEAFNKMKKVVSKVGGISPEIAKMLRENGKKMSTAELRLVTRKICHDAIIYYTKDAAEYEQIAAELDDMLFYAEWIKWFGDQAFSYLISTYYGSTADALLSPAKDIFAAFLGEVIDKLLYDEEISLDELETIKNITAGVDNLITNVFDDATAKDSKLSFKQVCAVVAGFLVWKIGKNIYENRDEDGKIDLYSAITALTADLTAMGVKKITGKFFNNALKNSSVQKALNNPIRKWLQNNVPNVVKGRWDIDKQGEYLFKIVEFKQSEVFKKYLEEFFGMGTAKVVEVGAEAVQDWRNSTGSDENTVDLSAWPRISWISEIEAQNGQKTDFMISVDLSFEVVGKFFDYLFGELFSEVPFATETKSPPVDPPYLPEKSFDTL
ncbi:MAG: hypothetical protein EOM05_03500 [Clostridia bacterium]|nr:hypothetical protein [Clostridia bacterium]